MIDKINDITEFDYDKDTVIVNGNSYSLDKTESKILKYLIDNKEKLCEYDKILYHLYGDNDIYGHDNKTINTYITRIKNKTQHTIDEHIINTRKKGYTFSLLVVNRSQYSEYNVIYKEIDNDYYVYSDYIEFVKHFVAKIKYSDTKNKNSIHFRITWFNNEDVEIIPLTQNIKTIENIEVRDTNRNYNIVFNEPFLYDQEIEYAIKVICSNKQHNFENFFSTQVIVPIENLHIHLHLCDESNTTKYFTQVLSDSLNNYQTEPAIEHEYIHPSHWHIKNLKLHFEYKIYW